VTPRGISGVGDRLSKVEAVATQVSVELHARGVQHAIIGGLAVIAHGYERSTADVDLLMIDRTALQGREIGIPGVGLTVDGVAVDVVYTTKAEKFLEREIEHATRDSCGRPVIGFEALIYLKLKSNRAKDRADVVELLKVNEASQVGAWLLWHASTTLLERFYDLARQAATEAR
jgi:predicted nucleotidyltransferase